MMLYIIYLLNYEKGRYGSIKRANQKYVEYPKLLLSRTTKNVYM
jgi:hypothetical protein